MLAGLAALAATRSTRMGTLANPLTGTMSRALQLPLALSMTERATAGNPSADGKERSAAVTATEEASGPKPGASRFLPNSNLDRNDDKWLRNCDSDPLNRFPRALRQKNFRPLLHHHGRHVHRNTTKRRGALTTVDICQGPS